MSTDVTPKPSMVEEATHAPYDTDTSHVPTPSGGRFSRRTVIVVIAVLVLAELVSRVLASGLPNPDWNFVQTDRKVEQMEELAAAGVTADVVLLGNSSVNAGFVNDELERLGGFDTVFNAGLDGSSVRQMEDWAKNVVVPLLQPKTVVIGLTSRDLNDASISNAEVFENYLNSRGRARFLDEESAGQRLNRVLSSASAIVQISPFIRDPSSLITQYNPNGPGTGEFVLPQEEYGPRSLDITRTRERALNDFSVGELEVEALDRLVTDLEAQGIQVIIVNMPFIPEDWLPLHGNGSEDYVAYGDALLDFTEARNLDLIDLQTSYPWATSEFYDFLHVNSAGIELINEILAEQLVALAA